MPIILEMPSLSPSMTQGNLVSWIKNEGDSISIGDVIAEIETDKAIMELESLYQGKLEKILMQNDSHDVLVKTPIAIIRQKNDTDVQIAQAINEAKSFGTKTAAAPSEKIEMKESEKDALGQSTNQHIDTNEMADKDARIKASPLAKKIAKNYGINLHNIKKGSGPNNRIVKSDILQHIQQSQSISQDSYADETPSSMRRIIAEKLTLAKREIPHFYITTSIEVDNLLKTRKTINQSGVLDQKILIDAFITKAVACAMLDVPEINVAWIDGKIRRYKSIDIAIAVAVDGGLLTPVVSNASEKSIATISKEISELSAKAKNGTLQPQEYSGGSITLSNLGMFDIDSFYSIVQPAQGSILSIGSAKKQPCVRGDEMVIKTMMNLGYAADHRCIDGAVGAKFLDCLKQYI